jgi:hypothetical protein
VELDFDRRRVTAYGFFFCKLLGYIALAPLLNPYLLLGLWFAVLIGREYRAKTANVLATLRWPDRSASLAGGVAEGDDGKNRCPSFRKLEVLERGGDVGYERRHPQRRSKDKTCFPLPLQSFALLPICSFSERAKSIAPALTTAPKRASDGH